MDLYLCSKSPRRADILSKNSVAYKIIENKLEDEVADMSLRPFDQIVNIAYMKSTASKSNFKGIILGADTGIIIDQKLIGKPSSEEDALRILTFLNGQTHMVVSACCLLNTINNTIDFCIDYTNVTFKHISTQQIKDYITKAQPMDKAGAYAIQDNPSFIQSISGELDTVIGLPMNKLLKLFRHYGIVK